MKWSSELYRLRAWGIRSMTAARVSVETLRAPLTDRDRAVCALAAVAASNAWRNLLRAYFVCAVNGGRLRGGQRTTTTIVCPNFEDALTFAVHEMRPNHIGRSGPWTHREEPDWSDPGLVASLLVAAGCSIAGDFTTAVSVGSSARQDLATYRNFIAHRNRETALKVRRLGAENGLNDLIPPIDIPLQAARQRPQTLLVDWLDDLWTIVTFLPA